MNPIPMSDKDAIEYTIAQEKQHKGERLVCDVCGKEGIVGDTLRAAFTFVMTGQGFPYWICQDCLEERLLAQPS